MPESSNATSSVRRVVGLALFTAACVAGVVAYIAVRERSGAHAPSGAGAPGLSSGPAQTVTLETITRAPHLYVRSYRGSEFGRVVVASLERPDDERVVTALECERLAFGGHVGLCLSDNRSSLQPPGLAWLVGEGLDVQHTLPLAGVPSRARVSRDETLAASTVFVAGESYASSSFSTRTHLIDMKSGQAMSDLEQFVTLRDGRPIKAADFNFWGVTFARDANRFYATLATNGRTYLVEGDVRGRTLRVMRENVECPSLSPDDARIVYKRRVEGTAEWRLHVLELATLRDWPLVEQRSIDDQVEWLDNDHVLYGFLEERGLPEEAMHVWLSPVAERPQQAPRLFVRAAGSPSVVRPPPSAGTP